MGNSYGLMIGGTPEPDDIVGMHIAMPTAPGVGVSVKVNEVNNALSKILSQIPADEPKAEQLKQMVNQAIYEQEPDTKFEIVSKVITFGAGVSQIASSIYALKLLAGY